MMHSLHLKSLGVQVDVQVAQHYSSSEHKWLAGHCEVPAVIRVQDGLYTMPCASQKASSLQVPSRRQLRLTIE